jgi:multisubunit Na+/H+ antiporter MnhF subunit
MICGIDLIIMPRSCGLFFYRGVFCSFGQKRVVIVDLYTCCIVLICMYYNIWVI